MRFLLGVGFVSFAVVAGCAPSSAEDYGSSADAQEVFADGLWAGQPSLTLARWTPDPCGDARRLDTTPISYDEWVRQRAAVKNVCFEVWKPGVTDTDNPNYWRELDVQIHYRYQGETAFTMNYVNSIDRRGNNRRYAWRLDPSIDPWSRGASSLATIDFPFTLVSESGHSSTGEGWARVKTGMEFYFTVNGKVLNASDGKSFRIDFDSAVRTNILHSANPSVLHEEIECDGAKFGGGAGYNAADITDAAAIDALGVGLDGSLVYGAGLNLKSTGAARALSINIGGGRLNDMPGETLVHYVDASWGKPNVEVVPNGSTMTLKLAAYDRAAKGSRTIERTFTGCLLSRP